MYILWSYILWSYKHFSKFCFEIYTEETFVQFYCSLISLVKDFFKKRKRPEKTACNFSKTWTDSEVFIKDFGNLLRTVISRNTFEWLPLNYRDTVIHKTSFVFTSVWNFFTLICRFRIHFLKSHFIQMSLHFADSIFVKLKFEFWC